MTTGIPISLAASQAASALSTTHPSGTGTPQDCNNAFVKSLSREMLSAMAGVRSVSAVQMCRQRAPYPNCTRFPLAMSRVAGILRATAASTIQAVEGPSQSESTRSRRCLIAPSTS